MCWKNITNTCKTKTAIDVTDVGKIQQNTTLYLCFMQKRKKKKKHIFLSICSVDSCIYIAYI